MSCLKIYLPFTHIISFSVAVVGAILALRYIYSAMGLGRGDSSGDNIMATSYLHYDRESRLVNHQEESPSEFPFEVVQCTLEFMYCWGARASA